MGAIAEYLQADHDRLDALLAEASARGRIEEAPFGRFREGLLRHIGMEEKTLFAAYKAARGEPVPGFTRLRSDHARLTALLVTTPTPAIAAAIRAILGAHNLLEEGAGGVYQACEEAIGDGADQLLAKLRNTPPPPLRPYFDSRRPVILDGAEDERG